MIILGHDPGFANYANVTIEWSTRVRRVLRHETVITKPKQPDCERWAIVNAAIHEAFEHLGFYDPANCRVACEAMAGVRAGKNREKKSNHHDDTLLEVQGAIRQEASNYVVAFYLIEPQSSTAALGAKIGTRPKESDDARKRRQKDATAAAVRLFLAGAENLTEHEYDACAHAIGVALGKGRRA